VTVRTAGKTYLGLLLLAACILAPKTFSQEQAPPGGGTENPAVAHQSREAAGEDETAEFKKSASVQMVARLTGLSLENAYWLSMGINFAIIAGAILWFSKKNLPGMFRGRTASIQKAMEEARKASEDANKRLTEIESRLSHLDEQISAMRAGADKEAAEEEARAKAATAEEVRKVIGSAEQEISAAAKTARRELTAYAADLAVSLAQKQIQVDTATDEALVRGFARQLSVPGWSSEDQR
jgi:F-type H+-transporting ATPase subunit b